MAGAGRLKELSAAVLARARPAVPDGPVVAALSGGADSAVLCWVCREAGSDLRSIHVDHGLIGSPALARAASDIAGFLEVPFLQVEATVAAGASQEGQARSARFAALEAAAAPGEWVALGHTADDQAETVIGNLLRGGGARGLAGMPSRRGRWIRPLLDVSRAETRELAGWLGLPFRDDPSNESRDHRRNVIRRDLIPHLEAQFNPALRRVLHRTAGVLAADDFELEKLAARVPITETPGAVKLPAPALVTLAPPVAARVVRRGLRIVRGPHAGSEREVAAVLEIATGARGAATLSTGLAAAREGPWVVLRRVETQPWLEGSIPLGFPGSARSGGLAIDAWIEEHPPQPWPLGRSTTVVDADRIGATALLRSAQPADRIDLTGGGSKAVTDALAAAGIPRRLRSGWPVVESRGKLALLLGVRAAAWVRPDAATTRFLWIVEQREER